MQLSLIRQDRPEDNDGKSRLWIRPSDKGLYFGVDRVFLNYDDPDSPATIGDLDRELERRDYFSIESKFIDSSGDLVFNTAKNNKKYNKVTKKLEYIMSEIVDKKGKNLGTTIRTYRRMESVFINSDTSLLSIDFLGGDQECKIVFPEDRVTSVSLLELAKKFVIPGVSCVLSDLTASYATTDSSDYTDIVLYNEFSKPKFQDPTLFKYQLFEEDNQSRRVYSDKLPDTPLDMGFVLDLTNDGLLSLHYYPTLDPSSAITGLFDYYIKSCSVKIKY